MSTSADEAPEKSEAPTSAKVAAASAATAASSSCTRETEGPFPVLHFSQKKRGAAFTHVTAEIQIQQQQNGDDGSSSMKAKKIGTIEGVVVHRKKIRPQGMFLSRMDEHSGYMQTVGVDLFEPLKGRTRLRTLVDEDSKGDFCYIDSLHYDLEYRTNGKSDLGAQVVRQYLQHVQTKLNVTTAAYILDPENELPKSDKQEREMDFKERFHAAHHFEEAGDEEGEAWLEGVTSEQSERDTSLARKDAIQFLRNGFVQDAALAEETPTRYLVASRRHWDIPALLSHEDAKNMDVKFLASKSKGHENKTIQLTVETGERLAYSVGHDRELQLMEYGSKVERLVAGGIPLEKSCVLHASVMANSEVLVDYWLRRDPSLIHARDPDGSTPLMLAAINAAGRSNSAGISECRILDKLLALGGRREETNKNGNTAYDVFLERRSALNNAIAAMCGRAIMGNRQMHPTEMAVAEKLKPRRETVKLDNGFVDYSAQEGKPQKRKRKS